MNRLELFEKILFDEENELQDIKVLLLYVLERLEKIEEKLDK